MRAPAAFVLLTLVALGCRRGTEGPVATDADDVGSDLAVDADTSDGDAVPIDTGTVSPDTLVDALLPDAWSGGPFAAGTWTTHTLDGGKCFMKLAHGAARDERASAGSLAEVAASGRSPRGAVLGQRRPCWVASLTAWTG